MTAAFAFAPGLVLRVAGQPAAIAQLRREYGPCEVAQEPASASLEVVFGSPAAWKGPPPEAVAARGSHKTVSWRVTLGNPADAPLRAWVSTGGWPAGFARSLVQGYVVEPLLSVAAARAGHVLLPAAGIVADDGLLVIIGRSRAGKSTIAARALANGRRVIGDDQVLVDAAGSWRPFPRRLRFYPDLVTAAPAAWNRLGRRTRAVLRGRRLVAAATRGFVRPSLAVPPAELGGRWEPDPLPAARIALVERRAGATSLVVASADPECAVAWAREVLAEQRSRLAVIGGAAWAPALRAVADDEAARLRRAFEDVPVISVVVPAGWSAPEGVSRTAVALGLERAL
jgi:hypothetical protein